MTLLNQGKLKINKYYSLNDVNGFHNASSVGSWSIDSSTALSVHHNSIDCNSYAELNM